MGYYIHKNAVVEKNEPIDSFIRSLLLEEKELYYIVMNGEQVDYYNRNPNSTVEEIFYLGINEIIN